MKTLLLITLALAALTAAEGGVHAATSPELAGQAYTILMERCHKCHGMLKQGFDASARDTMVAVEGNYLVPGNVEDSEIWKRVAVYEDMPPRGNLLSAEERDVLRQWILSGAEFPPPEQPRQPLEEAYILNSIDQHLAQMPSNDWQHQRYFSLMHLYNNPNVTDDHLRLYRAALSKVINSLSRRPNIVLPVSVDPAETVFNIDLRKIGWTDSEQWLQVQQRYPYGMRPSDPSIRDRMKVVTDRLGFGNLIAYVRADWFIVEASRPPLYDTLLKLPETEEALMTELGVEFKLDFENNQLARAGFTASNVSRHNRLIDRHVGQNTGYYYRSHDFGKSSDKALLSRFPLGPKFDGNPFDNFAYVQDGGEIVFRLPNGLQGYMIVDQDGKRIPVAPVEVVRDLKEIGGSPAVVNGISCIGCHVTGIQAYEDNIRQFVQLGGNEGDKVNRLYRANDELKSLQAEDRASFMRALAQATGPFLQAGKDKDRPLSDFPEPVYQVALRHQGGVGLEEVAYELGHDPAELRVQLSARDFQRLGVGPLLAKGNRIPRDMWESRADRGDSLFQAVGRKLGSTPLNIPLPSAN